MRAGRKEEALAVLDLLKEDEFRGLGPRVADGQIRGAEVFSGAAGEEPSLGGRSED
jgi:hypothetical protein